MAHEYNVEIKGQPYWNSTSERKVSVSFSMPEDEIIEKNGVPGIGLIIAGFGGDSSSNIYKKMRQVFADEYNLICIQCDYFGCEYMDKNLAEELQMYINAIQNRLSIEDWTNAICNNVDFRFESKICVGETKDCFCEMGVFQALDCANSVKAVMKLLDNIGVKYVNRIIAYGFSHGGYLTYLVNALFPNLLSNVLDNSGWLYPQFIDAPREMTQEVVITNSNSGQSVIKPISVVQRFHTKDFVDDLEIYDLGVIYSQFVNNANILCFHGRSDTLITIEHKKAFIDKINNATIEIIDGDKIDNFIFKNDGHGLGADFIELFRYVLDNKLLEDNIKQRDVWKTSCINTGKYVYTIKEINNLFELQRKNQGSIN